MGTLNDLMSFGHVVFSDGKGNVYGDHIHATEIVYQELDDDGQCIDDKIHCLPEGWETLSGFTGQYSYNGPVMHPSEYIGGGLERYIRENAGYYVALVVDGIGGPDDEDNNIGWAVAFKSAE